MTTLNLTAAMPLSWSTSVCAERHRTLPRRAARREGQLTPAAVDPARGKGIISAVVRRTDLRCHTVRPLVHIGLSALLVVAPALCCCNVRWLAGVATAAAPAPAVCPTCPQPAPAPPSCYHPPKSAKPAPKASCCHEAEPAPASADAKPAPRPPAPKPNRCECCIEWPDAVPPEGAPAVAAPEPTGELVSLALLGLADFSPEHGGRPRDLRSAG